MISTVQATRYVTPLREGGSLPALVEASDCGIYVLKFRGAGQGPLALVAEIIAGQIGRALGLAVPELVLVEVDAALGLNEADPEIRDLLRASVGLNLGVDYLPGSLMFDPAAGEQVDPDLASLAVWFDAFVTNVDRTARNPNVLCWHKNLYFIDHGAALYFHHAWRDLEQAARSPFAAIRDHVLLPWASRIEEADRRLRPRLSAAVFAQTIEQVPAEWLAPAPDLAPAPGAETAAARRAGYLEFLTRRLAAASLFVEEAVHARAELV
ncbi:MAG TPA: HipA family kinase [Thermoanaerobaculia bacterium]|nr:HipA family kinase [Thermoanaerobaculia bacterium]